MNLQKLLITTASFIVLAGCSSSGGGGAQLGQFGATLNPDPTTPVGNVAVFAAEEQNADDFPILLQGANGNLIGRVVSEDEENNSFVATIGNEEFRFDENRFDGELNVSDDNRVALIDFDDDRRQINGDRVTGIEQVFVIGEDLDSSDPTRIDNVGFLVGAGANDNNDIINTPIDQLPAQATYGGNFYRISERTATEGSDNLPDNATPTAEDLIENDQFTATATFGETNELVGSVISNGDRVGEIEADITGNTFVGSVSGLDGEGTATLNGGFFGENGQEILASGSGTIDGQASAVALIGDRTDNVPTN